MQWLPRAVDQLNESIGRLASFLILLSVGVTLFEVVMRYGFDRPTIWVNETVLILFGFYFLLGGGYTLLHGGHVKVDVLLMVMSARTKRYLNIFAYIVALFYLLVLLWISGGQALESIAFRERAESSWGPYIFPVISAVPIAAALMILQAVAHLAREVSGGTAAGPGNDDVHAHSSASEEVKL